jgi:hypothetical protein
MMEKFVTNVVKKDHTDHAKALLSDLHNLSLHKQGRVYTEDTAKRERRERYKRERERVPSPKDM